MDIERRIKCPKCGAESGDDWSQCGAVCPIPGSPHYDPECRVIEAAKTYILLCKVPGALDRRMRGGYCRSEAEEGVEFAYVQLSAAVEDLLKPSPDPDSCCDAEDRGMEGGCRNCGDPCL